MVPAGEMHYFRHWDFNSLLNLRVRQRGPHPALVWAPFDEAAQVWTYSQLQAGVEAWASHLCRRGVDAGDQVLLHLSNSPASILCWLACAHIGAEAVTSNSKSSVEELRFAMTLTAVVGAITQPDLARTVESSLPSTAWIEIADPHGGHTPLGVNEEHGQPPVAPNAMRPISIQFTSGTTSRPKAVRWTHANALWGARASAAHAGVGPQDVTLVHAPLSHTMAWSWQVLATLWAGGTIVLQPKFSSSRFWDVSEREGCTWTYMVPFCVNALTGEPPAEHRYRFWGGWTDSHSLSTRFGVPLVGSWGMTEIITQGVFGELLGGSTGAVGRPVPEYAVAIVDDSGRPVEPGESGSLRVGGTPGISIFLEYVNDPEATAAAFDDHGRFCTGDRMTLLDDGRLRFADRDKDMLKVGGENVGAAEIERVVRSVDGVFDTAVVGRAHPMLGEVPVAFVVRTTSADDDHRLTRAILDRCRRDLSEFKIPVAINFLSDLPRGNLGKVLKAELRRRASQSDE